MMRKTCVIMLSIIILCGIFMSVCDAADMKAYKIKRLVAQLYDKKDMMDARRKLSGYGTEVTPYLLPVLKEKDNNTVKVAALRLIGEVDDKSAEDAVIAVLDTGNHRVRQEAAKTLGIIGSKKSVAPLKELLFDHYPNVRFNAIRALARIAPKEEVDLFIEVLGDYDPRIRMFAVIALGKLKSEKAVPYLSQLVNDYDPAVRFQLVKALGNIGTKDCLPPLEWLMGDPDTNVRIMAVEQIAKVNSPGTDDALVKASKSSDPRIAGRAIKALGDRKSPKALAVAKEHIDNEHMSVKMASIEVIGKMGGSSEKPLLESMKDAESTRVRNQSRAALTDIDNRT